MRLPEGSIVFAAACLLLAGCAAAPPLDAACQPRPDGPVCEARPAGPLAALDMGREVRVVVNAQCHWNHSGIAVEPGAVYQLAATVRAQDPWVDSHQDAALDTGWTGAWPRFIGRILQPGARAPGLPMYALVAAQGADPANFSLAGVQGAVDSKVLARDPPTELLFFANDWSGFYGNNHGCVDVTVRRLR